MIDAFTLKLSTGTEVPFKPHAFGDEVLYLFDPSGLTLKELEEVMDTAHRRGTTPSGNKDVQARKLFGSDA